MRVPKGQWLDAFRTLGEALLDVLGAEWRVLTEDWRRSQRSFTLAVSLIFLAAGLAFLLLGLLVYSAVKLLEKWVEPWQAGLWVGLVVALVAAGAGFGAWYLMRFRFENPIDSARRRFDDHAAWWSDRLLPEERALKGESGGEAESLGGTAESESD